MIADGLIDPNHCYGTINCNGGERERRYLRRDDDQRAGLEDSRAAWATRRSSAPACTSTATSARRARPAAAKPTSTICAPSSSSRRCGAECIRRTPGMEALRRIKANTVEKRLLNREGQPNFNVKFYIVNAKGEYAGVSMYGGKDQTYAVCTEQGAQTVPTEPLLNGTATD